MRKSIRNVSLVIGLAVLAALGAGTVAAGYDTGWDPNPRIPKPEGMIGHPLGDRFTPHHRIVDYLETLAASSDRILLERYGVTAEGRPLMLLTVSDPENLARVKALRETYQKLSDPRSLGEAEARGLARDTPVAVWLSFNIHGDEASSSEAAMALAYRLAADTGPEMAELLRSTVVLIDPCLNPDGRDRYVNWLNGVSGRRPDPLPASREHHQPWPGGRYNHYLFDLNRDWAWLTQEESRSRAVPYLSWKPQVHVDFHEMWFNSTYFFFPPERPIHPLLHEEVKKWGPRFGAGNADAFDERGWRYYTSESFDLYYPGYGDSWPSFHGAIGMTYEQAGHGFAGIIIERAPGDTLTLAQRAEHHYVAALATLRTAATHREEKLLDFYRFFKPEGDGVSYLFPPGNDPPRTVELIRLLMAHGVEVDVAEQPLRVSGLQAFDGSELRPSLPAGTYVVSGKQPLHRFIRAVLEPETALPDTFFYDISAWSLPLAFGIDAYWTSAAVNGSRQRLTSPPEDVGHIADPQARYAFLISWERNAAARAAAWLMDHDVQLHFATRDFSAAGRTFRPGTLVIFRSGNPDNLTGLMERCTRETAVEVFGVDSGRTESGPDLGSFRVRRMKKPRVALMSGDPVSPTSAGACWFLLDRMYDVPHSLITPDAISEETLEAYSVLVFPDDGSGGASYAAHFDSVQIQAVEKWVLGGGVFVGLGGGAFFASADHSGLSSVSQSHEDEEEGLTEEERLAREKERRRETRIQREQRERREVLPGTIFRVEVDPLHPLAFGYSRGTRVMKISRRALELGPPGTNVAWFTESPKVSGYAPPRSVEHLADTPFLVDEPRGSGHVVLYVEDPNFRLFWYGLNKLFLNSVYFLPSLSGH